MKYVRYLVFTCMCTFAFPAGAATDLNAIAKSGEVVPVKLPINMKDEIFIRYINSANDCVIEKVRLKRQFDVSKRQKRLTDDITDACVSCQSTFREMVEAHDRLYGASSGEDFLMGPFLDLLPTVVRRRLNIEESVVAQKKKNMQ